MRNILFRHTRPKNTTFPFLRWEGIWYLQPDYNEIVVFVTRRKVELHAPSVGRSRGHKDFARVANNIFFYSVRKVRRRIV